MSTTQANRPITSLLTQVVSDIAYLLQTEIRLARTELNEKLGKAANSGKSIGAGAILVLAGLVVLLLAAARFLTAAGMPEEWSLTLVGLVAFAVGIALTIGGVKEVARSVSRPHRTLDQLQADLSLIKEQRR